MNSYECSEKFVRYGNDFLRRNNIDARIEQLPVNYVPDIIRKYDGIIIGWGSYTHIHGRINRIGFLKKFKPFCQKGTHIMISFYTKEGSGKEDKIVNGVSNFFRCLTFRPRTEYGDMLRSYFAHCFNREEIESELNQAGFRMLEYYDEEYGCAVGVWEVTG